MGFTSAIIEILLGILLKVSTEENLRPYKKYWIYMVIMGVLLLGFQVYKMV